LGAGFGDPTPKNAAAFGVELRFGGVEGAVIEQSAFLRMKEMFLRVIVADFPENFALRGIKKDVLSFKREEVGALPHIAGIDWIGPVRARRFAVGEGVEKFPAAEIGRAVEKDPSTSGALSGADAHVPDVVFAPEARIAEAGEFGIARRKKYRSGVFSPGAEIEITRGGQALGFKEIVAAVAKSRFGGRDGLDAGVEKRSGAFMDHSAAREAAVRVGAAGCGRKGDREVAPVEHVRADGMGPVHVAPNGGARIVLEEHVVTALPVNRAVGVVHPVAGRKEMELRAEEIGGELGFGGRVEGIRG